MDTVEKVAGAMVNARHQRRIDRAPNDMKAVLVDQIRTPNDDGRDDARAAIEAYEAALKEHGLVIVPREPTEGMENAGSGDAWGNKVANARRCWRAMLDAAPHPSRPKAP